MEYNPLISLMVDAGVPIRTVSLLLMLPIIATMVAFFRQVVGIKAFGIYTPSIITFALLAFDPNGLKYGIAIFVAVIGVGMLTRYLLRRLRILYLPRVAITISTISIAVLGVLALSAAFSRTGLANVSIFPLLIMITLAEKFIATQIEKGDRAALMLALETLIISLVGYFLLNYHSFEEFILRNPWVVLATFAINIALGKWAGLRLSEYIRFRQLIKRG